MHLTHLKYSEFSGKAREWRVAIDLGSVNLIVGRNATGKSRTLSVINTLGTILQRKIQVSQSDFSARFDHEGSTTEYTLRISGGKVIREILRVDGRTMLRRDATGKGKLEAVEWQKQMSFRVPEGEPAAAAKRDLIQHPYLEPLLGWAEARRFYNFGGSMGQHTIGILDDSARDVDPGDPNKLIGLFRRAEKQFGRRFTKLVMADMKSLGYRAKSLGIGRLPDIVVAPKLVKPVGFFVQESHLRARTWQLQMSQGMFRALSLIIHLAYAELASKPSCIIIDDIGEGLDHERTVRLLRLLIRRAERRSIQLVMATNNRFIMNAVPLDYWRGLLPTRTGVRVLSPTTHPAVFERFRRTGLSNFDFLATGFMRSRSR